MGFFIMRKWNKNIVRGKLLNCAGPEKVFQKLKDDLLESMQRVGTIREQRALEKILKDFDATLPKKMSKNRLRTYANLLIDTINLWGLGKIEQDAETAEVYKRRMRKAGMKPEQASLISQAEILYDAHNKDVRGAQKWAGRISRKLNAEIFMYNPTMPNNTERVRIRDLKQITMKEAFRRAGGDETDYRTYIKKTNRDRNRRKK